MTYRSVSGATFGNCSNDGIAVASTSMAYVQRFSMARAMRNANAGVMFGNECSSRTAFTKSMP